MRITGGAKLRDQLRALPPAARDHVTRAVARNTKKGAQVARFLAPDVTGETRQDIQARFPDPNGLEGVVEAIKSDAPRPEKDRAYSIEHGRKTGSRGTTQGFHHMHATRKMLRKEFSKSIKAAIRRAAKEVTRG